MLWFELVHQPTPILTKRHVFSPIVTDLELVMVLLMVMGVVEVAPAPVALVMVLLTVMDVVVVAPAPATWQKRIRARSNVKLMVVWFELPLLISDF